MEVSYAVLISESLYGKSLILGQNVNKLKRHLLEDQMFSKCEVREIEDRLITEQWTQVDLTYRKWDGDDNLVTRSVECELMLQQVDYLTLKRGDVVNGVVVPAHVMFDDDDCKLMTMDPAAIERIRKTVTLDAENSTIKMTIHNEEEEIISYGDRYLDWCYTPYFGAHVPEQSKCFVRDIAFLPIRSDHNEEGQEKLRDQVSSTVRHTIIGAVMSGNRGDKILRITPDDLFKMADRETAVFIGEDHLRGWVVPPPVCLASEALVSPGISNRRSQLAKDEGNRSSSAQPPPQMYLLHFCAKRKLREGNCGRIIYVKQIGSGTCYRLGMLIGRVRDYPNIYQAVVLCHNIDSLVKRYRKISTFNLIDGGGTALEATCHVDDLMTRSYVKEVETRCKERPIGRYRELEEAIGTQPASVQSSSNAHRYTTANRSHR